VSEVVSSPPPPFPFPPVLYLSLFLWHGFHMLPRLVSWPWTSGLKWPSHLTLLSSLLLKIIPPFQVLAQVHILWRSDILHLVKTSSL
jgi:hypothetical protein